MFLPPSDQLKLLQDCLRIHSTKDFFQVIHYFRPEILFSELLFNFPPSCSIKSKPTPTRISDTFISKTRILNIVDKNQNAVVILKFLLKAHQNILKFFCHCHGLPQHFWTGAFAVWSCHAATSMYLNPEENSR